MSEQVPPIEKGGKRQRERSREREKREIEKIKERGLINILPLINFVLPPLNLRSPLILILFTN